MASIGNITVNIVIEKTIQSEVAKAAQKIYDEHGLMINSIRFEWIQSADGKAFVCRTDMDSSARNP